MSETSADQVSPPAVEHTQHAQHYAAGDVVGRILAALNARYGEQAPLTTADLTTWDQFHSGGIEATQALLQRADIQASERVLDIGGGLGGSARVLAQQLGCHVTVLDLTDAYCQIGAELTRRSGLSEQVQFWQGDALELPFADGSFEVVWTQHSSMNIADKARLYGQIQRVLRPGGRLVLHEVAAGSGQALHYPLPWARSEAATFLQRPNDLRQSVSDAGFVERDWADLTDWTLGWFQRQQSAAPNPGTLNLSLLLGPDAASMGRNFALNVQQGRIRVIQGVFKRL
ncbi:class I SAM-dependent methyltransferase [Deinococcus sp.]|uniref:class I SAM-dependent methyltransferase n=1 Tax=Deinococcus sp. TaxID=47478 RepID=UPI003CC5F56B